MPSPADGAGECLHERDLTLHTASMRLRTATTTDRELLVRLLAEAVNWNGEVPLTPSEIMAEPETGHHVTDWQRPTDFGTVAVTDDEEPVGAIWARVFPLDHPGYGFVAEGVPELGMAVLPGRRGEGVGGVLLGAFIEQARALGRRALSLSVEHGNDAARRLYGRHHFHVVGRNGGSDTMLLDLRAPGGW